jgi:hypothetical protein
VCTGACRLFISINCCRALVATAVLPVVDLPDQSKSLRACGARFACATKATPGWYEDLRRRASRSPWRCRRHGCGRWPQPPPGEPSNGLEQILTSLSSASVVCMTQGASGRVRPVRTRAALPRWFRSRQSRRPYPAHGKMQFADARGLPTPCRASPSASFELRRRACLSWRLTNVIIFNTYSNRH